MSASTVETTSRAELLDSLTRHNQTFTALLSLIPSHLYARPSDQEAEDRWKVATSKKGKAQAQQAVKRGRDEVDGSGHQGRNSTGDRQGKGVEGTEGKQLSKEGRKREEERRRLEAERKEGRKKGKMARLDPDNLPPVGIFSTSTSAKQNGVASSQASNGDLAVTALADQQMVSASSTKGKGKSKASSTVGISSMPPAIPPSSLRSPLTQSLPRHPESAPESIPANPSSATASISDLRARLHHKIQSLQRSRGLEISPSPQRFAGGAEGSADIDDNASEAGSRDALEREMRERRERRAELRENRRAKRKAGREDERAAERAEAKEKARLDRLAQAQGQAHSTSVLGSRSGHGAGESDGLSYQAFSLPASNGSGSGSQPGPSSNKFKHISNPSQALSHLQARQSKVENMSDERRLELTERDRWAKAEERAAGGKVVDEERTLKKAVKRLEKRKAKSGKEWNDRKKALALSQQAAIKKRNDNIASRNEARKNKKKGVKGKGDKSASKGKKRPGFEGGRPPKKSKSGSGGGGGADKGKGSRKS